MQTTYYCYFYEERPATAPCPTGDELLDQQAMRDFLRAAWDSSNVNDLPPNRRERGGFLFEDSSGSLVYGVAPLLETDTPCTRANAWSSPLLGVPVAEGHTHPFVPGDTLPSNCPQTQKLRPGQAALYGVQKFGGASDSDVVAMQGDSLPMYILEKDSIRAFPVGTTLDNAKSIVKAYPRVDPATSCLRL